MQVVGDGRPGGGTTAVLTLSRLLSERGCNVMVVSQQGSYLLEQARISGFKAQGLDFSSRLNTLNLAVKLSRLFGSVRPAVVHAHGARAGLPVALAARSGNERLPIRLVYTVHGFHYLNKPPGLYQLARSAEAFCIKQADCVTFVSGGDCQIARRAGLLKRARAYRTIRNAVMVDSRLASSPKIFDIGFLGRLVPQKNPLLLVDILKAMRPLNATLSIIGGGPLEAKLRSRIEQEGLGGQVVMHGECSRADALRLASSCRVLVLPSLWEGHPIVLLEAMHLGIPVVASAVSGSDEIISHDENGYLVPVHDAAGYADALARLLIDDGKRQAISRKARRFIAMDYSPEQMVSAHMDVYEVCSSEPISNPVLAIQ